MQKICSRHKYTKNTSLFTVAPYILNNLVVHQSYCQNHCIMKKHHLIKKFDTKQIWWYFLGAKWIDSSQFASQNRMLWEFGKNNAQKSWNTQTPHLGETIFFCTVSPPQQTPKTNFQIWVLQVIYRHKHNVYNWNFSHQMVVLKIYVTIYFLGWNAYVIKFLKFFITVMMTWISHHSKCYFGKLAPSFPLSISGRKCI